jgi:glycosyltransferase involved in cell wall biosynthesis
MKVVVLTNMYPSRESPSTGSFVRDQVEDLQTLGIEVDVLAFDGRTHSVNYARAAGRLRTRIRSSPVDLVHAHYGLTGAVSLAQGSVPVVTTFHGSDVGYVRWQAPISWVVARSTTPIFVARHHAERLGLPDAHVIPAGVSTTEFQIRPRSETRRRLGWDEKARYVLLPGARTNRIKCAELFDEAVHLAHGVTGVALEGYTRAEVCDVLNAVDAVLVTSHSEGSPVTIKEALACGTPVVTVPVGDVPEVVAGLPGCFVRPRDPVALAAAVCESLAADDREALRERAVAYDRVTLARRVVAVYETVLATR